MSPAWARSLIFGHLGMATKLMRKVILLPTQLSLAQYYVAISQLLQFKLAPIQYIHFLYLFSTEFLKIVRYK